MARSTATGKRSLPQRAARFVRQRILWPFCFDTGDWRQTVFLAGVGRSGTTWIQDLINRDRDCRIMFEPFYRLKTALIRHWREHQYLPPDVDAPEFVEPARQVLSGRIHSLWINRFNTRRIARRRIIKDIRAGLFLYWIRRHFPEIPIVIVIRNPFAVVQSQLQSGWDVDMNDYLDQPRLVADWLGGREAELRSAATAFERNMFRWCIENYVPFCQFAPGEALVVAYEECCSEPEQVNRQLSNFLGRSWRALPASLIERPSAATRPGSAIESGGPLLRPASDWFDESAIDTGLRILRLFGMDALYRESPELRMPADQILGHFGGARSLAAR
jgi:hypothetical protein